MQPISGYRNACAYITMEKSFDEGYIFIYFVDLKKLK